MMRRFLALGVVAALTSSCGPAGRSVVRADPDGNGQATVVRATETTGATAYARRIDGDVHGIFRARLIGDVEQTVVLTGTGAGSDQCSMIVLDDEGSTLMRHQLSGETPAGYRMQFLAPAYIQPYDHRGRRFLAFPTASIWSPYSVAVLEVLPDRRIVTRERFWNPGAVNTPVMGHGWVAFRCLNNAYRDGKINSYPIAICVLSLDHVIDATQAHETVEGAAPIPSGASGSGYLRYFVLPERETNDQQVPTTVTIEPGRVQVRLDIGVTYVLDPVAGTADVDADELFRARHERRRASGADLVPIDELLASLRSRIVIEGPK